MKLGAPGCSKRSVCNENERNDPENEPGRILPGCSKHSTRNDLNSQNKYQQPAKWFENSTTQALINECKNQTEINEVHYELAKGIPKRFAGTYVHEFLYDHFLAWLDPKYAIKISVILKQMHKDANQKIIQEIVQEKYNAYNRLEQAMQKASEESKARDEAQAAEIQKLLSYAKDTTQDLSKARTDIKGNTIDIARLTDKVEECRDVIVDRTKDQSLKTKSITKHQYVVCLQHPTELNRLYVIRGQKSNITAQRKKHPGWETVLEPIFDPNAIMSFNRIKERVIVIEDACKAEVNRQYQDGEIDRDIYHSKMEFIRKNPLITIKHNNVAFATNRINLEQVLQLMQNISLERFELPIP